MISKKGVQYFPDSSTLWGELAMSENELHNQQEAVDAATKAKTLDSNEVTNFLYDTLVTKQGEIPSFMIQMILK